MISAIINSEKSTAKKIEALRVYVASGEFLKEQIDGGGFIRDLLVFATRVFDEYPPDAGYELGERNGIRVFMIKVLARLDYSGDEVAARLAMRMVYDLLARENMFNRYLALRVLYPLLRAGVLVEHTMLLKVIGTFFIAELPRPGVNDLSKYELGFFAASEALMYLKEYQKLCKLTVGEYETILNNLCAALRSYFGSNGVLENTSKNKKAICEYVKMIVNLLQLLNEIHKTGEWHAGGNATAQGHPMRMTSSGASKLFEYLPDLCRMLVVLCPSDCKHLRADVIIAIASIIKAYPGIFTGVEIYFSSMPFLTGADGLLRLAILSQLSRLIPLSSKTAIFEFDRRITEMLPLHNDFVAIRACLQAYIANLDATSAFTPSPGEWLILLSRNIRNAHCIFNLLHMDRSGMPKQEPVPLDWARLAIEGTDCTHLEAFTLLIEYFKKIVRTISISRLPARSFDTGCMHIMAKFFLWPLNDYASYDYNAYDGMASGNYVLNGPARIPATPDFYASFVNLPAPDIDLVVRLCADELFISYSHLRDVWGVLLENHVSHVSMIRAANALLHRDFMNRTYKSINFYEAVFPVAYGFFKLDKKHYKSDFTDLFTVIYNCMLEFELDDSVEGYSSFRCHGQRDRAPSADASLLERRQPFTPRQIFSILNKMYLDIKISEVAYTGLHFIYTRFEKTVDELYSLYCLTNDLFYIECLFNIPVSLNLLITKYAILIKPMEVGLKSTARLRDIVLKYIEYIIEFDDEQGMMDTLLIEMYKILRNFGYKAIRVLYRLTNAHRVAISKAELSEFIRDVRQNGKYGIGDVWQYKEGNVTVQENGKSFTYNSLPSIIVDKPVNMLMRCLVGYDFIHESYFTETDELLMIVHTRELNKKEINYDAMDRCRDELISYWLNALNYKEYLYGDDGEDVQIESPVAGYLINDVYSKIKWCLISDGNEDDGIEDPLSYAKHVTSVAEDILLAFYIDNNGLSRDIVEASMISYAKSVCRRKHSLSERHKVFVHVLVDAAVYAPERTKEMICLFIRTVDELLGPSSPQALEIKNEFICGRVHGLIEEVYKPDDRKSARALQMLKYCVEVSTFYVDPRICLAIMFAVKYKLSTHNSYRLYAICVELVALLFYKFEESARAHFEQVFIRGMTSTAASADDGRYRYLKMLHLEIEYLFALNTKVDLPVEIDRRCAFRVLKMPRRILERCPALVAHSVSFLCTVERADAYATKAYALFLREMEAECMRFNDLLNSAKRHLPIVAVLEGFTSLNSRRKFAESVNRNGQLQTNTPSAFRVFRGLFYKCPLSPAIKANFMEFYNSLDLEANSFRAYEYRTLIYDTLLCSANYDIVTVDFLLTKLPEINHISEDEIFSTMLERMGKGGCNGLSHMTSTVSDDILRYVLENIGKGHVFSFALQCIPCPLFISYSTRWISEAFYTISTGNGMMDHNTFSRKAFYVLRYLKVHGIHYENNKVVLLVYRDMVSEFYKADLVDLLNWYFVKFSPDEIELLYRIDPAIMLFTGALLVKICEVEQQPLRNWLMAQVDRYVSEMVLVDGGYASEVRDGPIFPQTGVVVSLNSLDADNVDSFEEIDDSHSCVTYSTETNSLFVDEEDGDYEDTDSLSYDPTFSNVSVDGMLVDSMSTEDDVNFNYQEYNNNCIVDNMSNGMNNTNTMANAIVTDRNTRVATINLHNVGQKLLPIAQLFADNPLPAVMLFSKFNVGSQQLVSLCHALKDDASFRCAAMVYLCKFDPRPEYISIILKLSFQERASSMEASLALIDHLGCEPFLPILGTVLRSEIRWKTCQYLILPIIIKRPEIANNSEIFQELCFLAYRFFKIGEVEYNLLDLITRIVADKYTSNDTGNNIANEPYYTIVRELNTLVIYYELENDKFRIFHTCTNFDLSKILRTKNTPALFDYLNRFFEQNAEIYGLKKAILEIFTMNPTLPLCKQMIVWLFGIQHGSPVNVPSLFITSTIMENQMNLLEIVLLVDPTLPLCLDLLVQLVKGYTDSHRLLASVTMLARAVPVKVAKWMLSEENIVNYPLLVEVIPDLLQRVDSLVGVPLCLISFHNLEREFIDANFLHLFRLYSQALPFRKEFYIGSMSPNAIIRHGFNSIWFNQIPPDTVGTLEFLLTNDWSGLEKEVVEYLTCITLMKLVEKYNGPIDYNNEYSKSGIELLSKNFILYKSIKKKPMTFEMYCDLMYWSGDCLPTINNFLVVSFSLIDMPVLTGLFKMLQITNMECRTKMAFVRAFDSRGLVYGEIYYNVYNPSIRYLEYVGDRPMYYGKILAESSIRELKEMAKLMLFERDDEALDVIFRVFKGVEECKISYKRDDLMIMEREVAYIYENRGIGYSLGIIKNGKLKGDGDVSVSKGGNSVSKAGKANKGDNASKASKGDNVSKASKGDNSSIGNISKAGNVSIGKGDNASISNTTTTNNPTTNTLTTPSTNTPTSITTTNTTTTTSKDIRKKDANKKKTQSKCSRFLSSHLTQIEQITKRFNALLDYMMDFTTHLPDRDDVLAELEQLREGIYILSSLPRSSQTFSKLLLYATICSEIHESYIILTESQADSIYGRFRLWMMRHPSMMAEMSEWLHFMRWRLYIFNLALGLVSESDKKKISNEMCKLIMLYGTKAYNECQYIRATYILNNINGVAMVELNQCIQKYFLDIKCLYEAGEYMTIVSLINNINVSKLCVDERARLYYWASKIFTRMNKINEADKFGSLSRKMAEIVENKKEYIKILKETLECGVYNSNMNSVSGVGNVGGMGNVSGVNSVGGMGNVTNCGVSGVSNVTNTTIGNVTNTTIGNVTNTGIGNVTNTISTTNFNPINSTTNLNPTTNTTNPTNNLTNPPTTNTNPPTTTNLNDLRKHYAIKLIELINELPIADGRIFMIEYIKNGMMDSIEQIQSDKLYFWTNQLGSKISYLYSNRLYKSSLESTDVFEKIFHGKYAGNMCEGERPSKPNNYDKFKIDDGQEEFMLRLQVRTAPLIIHVFAPDTALPGQFTTLRDEYNNIKVMCYIEEPIFAYAEKEGFFFVRNTDGTLTRLAVGEKKGGGYLWNQMYQLISSTITNHLLSKAGFNVYTTTITESVTIHNAPAFQAVTGIKLQVAALKLSLLHLFSKDYAIAGCKNSNCKVCSKLKHDQLIKSGGKFSLAEFATAMVRWQGLLKSEVVARISDSNDFYIFKSNFVNSYSSLIALQYMMGRNEISLFQTFIHKQTGHVSVIWDENASTVNEDIKNTSTAIKEYADAKFYLRPNFGYLMGDEGKNGPLALIMVRFAEAYSKNRHVADIIKFFCGEERAAEAAKRLSKLMATSTTKAPYSVELVIGEMIDPKTGMLLEDKLMPWI